MHQSTIDILALCDELLLAIFNKLNNIEILYSFIGVNQKLDRLAQDITFTRSVDLATISSNEHDDSRNNSMLDRFCFDIIPQIQHNIECLTLNSLSIDRVLCMGNYPKLHQITFADLQYEIASRIFNNESSFIHIFQHQISHLTVILNGDSIVQHRRELSTNVFTTIFTMFTNLTYLHFGLQDTYLNSPTSFNDLLSAKCYPSNIVYLNVTVCRFDDCLYLIDGRLSQLHTFIVQVDRIDKTSMPIHKMKTVSSLKCFSLFSFHLTREYDNQIVPFLRQILQLEKLTLSLIVSGRTSCIDGTHLVNDILNKMSHLQTFIFNIITQTFMMSEELLPTPDDVGRALIERGYNVECYTDYCKMNMGQCHIYSLPFTMERMDTFTSKFPGSSLMSVRHLVAHGLYRPFKDDFLVRISQAFPLLHKLTINNFNDQTKKLTHQQDEHEQISSIIEFPRLKVLHLSMSSLDYAKQILPDFTTRLPCLNMLYIKYIDLVIVTKNFTNNVARVNCSKLQHIILESPPKIYPENFHVYFPLL